MKPIDIILLLILALTVYLAIRAVVKNKKSGGCASCSNCQNKDCPKVE